MNKRVNSWLWKVSGKKKLYIPILAFISAVSGVSGVLYALLLREIVDSAIAKDINEFKKYAGFTILLVIIQLLLRALIRWLNELAKAELENRFKERLFSEILYKRFEKINAIHSGEWMNRLTNDTKIVSDGLVDIIPGLCGMVSKLIGAVVMIVALDVRLAGIIIPCAFIFGGMTYVFRKVLKKLHKQVQEKDGLLRIFFQDHLGSLMVIRSFAKEEEVLSIGKDKMKAHKAVRMKRNYFSNFCNLGFGTAMNGMYLLGVIYCGYGILTGRITIGTLTAITQLISQIQSPFTNITGYLPRYYAVIASAERLMDVESFEKEDYKKLYSKDEIRDYYNSDFLTLGLKNVSFSYYPIADAVGENTKENMPLVLKNLSLDINKSEFVAFTGQSGCGKSTVLKVLMSIYKPDMGYCYLRNKDGDETPLDAGWRKLFAYVPQGNHLMSGTIKEAVSFSNSDNDIDIERLNKALEISCAKEFVDDLEGGVNTLLGERGSGLSEGQIQRLSIARAIYADNPILLLDEATSALDGITERKLLENLKNMTDKTVIIVTHRVASLEICDREICLVDKL